MKKIAYFLSLILIASTSSFLDSQKLLSESIPSAIDDTWIFQGGLCPPSFSPTSFQGHTGKVAFYNEWDVPVIVVLYHPNTRSVYNSYAVAPKQNQFLGNNIIVGDDWGVCFKINNMPRLVNNLGRISDYEPSYQGSPLFMIQNNRINREAEGQVCGGFQGISCPNDQTCIYPVTPVVIDGMGICQ